jgi:hypothetical protein
MTVYTDDDFDILRTGRTRTIFLPRFDYLGKSTPSAWFFFPVLANVGAVQRSAEVTFSPAIFIHNLFNATVCLIPHSTMKHNSATGIPAHETIPIDCCTSAFFYGVAVSGVGCRQKVNLGVRRSVVCGLRDSGFLLELNVVISGGVGYAAFPSPIMIANMLCDPISAFQMGVGDGFSLPIAPVFREAGLSRGFDCCLPRGAFLCHIPGRLRAPRLAVVLCSRQNDPTRMPTRDRRGVHR